MLNNVMNPNNDEPVIVSEFRLSFIQVATFDNIIIPRAPFGFLSTTPSYNQEFINTVNGVGKFTLPLHSSNFWRKYLNVQKFEDAVNRNISHYLIPVFIPNFLEIHIPQFPWVRVAISGYCWPHCIGIVITLTIKHDLPIQNAIDDSMKMRYRSIYSNKLNSKEVYSLDKLFDYATVLFKNLTWGNDAAPGNPGELFSVITFITGTGVKIGHNIEPDSTLDKALYGLTKWNERWQESSQFKRDNLYVDNLKGEPIPGNEIYHSKRSRVVWFPSHFEKPSEYDASGKKVIARSNGCYHNNLTTLSLQVESLGALAKFLSRKLNDDQIISQTLNNFGACAVTNLLKLYTGKDTYRSTSAKYQIIENDFVSQINQVSDYFNLPKIVINLNTS